MNGSAWATVRPNRRARRQVRRALQRRAELAAATAAVATAGLVAVSLPPTSSNATSAMQLVADTTALVVCGTTCPTPDQFILDTVRDQYIAPTHPGQIDYVPVTTPQEYGLLTGALRVLGMTIGDPRMFGPGSAAWPDQPWWKLAGLFNLSPDQSVRQGADDLELAISEHGNDHLVIYGISQGAGVANIVKRRLAEKYADEAPPNIDFVLQGDPNLPNGGLASRFSGLYIPVLDLTFNGMARTDTPFDTVEITRQYDGASDFPLYPLNVVADLNAIMGFLYLHTNSFDVSLAADPSTYQVTSCKPQCDTTYYFFPTDDLPLFAPLRAVGVPEPLIDVIEPATRVIVELGYDRSIPLWQPTPARLIPKFDPVQATADLVDAVAEGAGNAVDVTNPSSMRSFGDTETVTDAVEKTVDPDKLSAVTELPPLSTPKSTKRLLNKVSNQVQTDIRRTVGKTIKQVSDGLKQARSDIKKALGNTTLRR